MLPKTLQRFRILPQQTRAMVFLHWVYTFVNTISGIFISILVFVETQSIVALVQYAFFIWIGTAIGFCLWGYIVAQKQTFVERCFFAISFFFLRAWAY